MSESNPFADAIDLMTQQRSSGLLLHITSLPGRFGSGDIGPAAYAFADLLHAAGQQLWQILPIMPVGFGHSPYAALSTFAGNPLLISPELLVEEGLLLPGDLDDTPVFPTPINFERADHHRRRLLERAFERFEEDPARIDGSAFADFCERNAGWLDDYALFVTIKEENDLVAWTDWREEDLRRRIDEELRNARRHYATEIRKRRFWQFLFDRQWSDLRTYCNERGIRIFGDLPIYVAHDSADVWTRPDLFHLADDGRPTLIAGVPPDSFSATGQRWGNPIFRWERMREEGFAWWIQRIGKALEFFDILRIDHFRGFEAYWEIPADEPTAVNGRWVQAPGAELFEALEQAMGNTPIVAENLGVITPGVTALMEQFEIPGMAVLQFAFDGDASSYHLPHNHVRDQVVYTGTHDNDTTVGWWDGRAGTTDASVVESARGFARAYLDLDAGREAEAHRALVRAALASPANMCVVPVQDILSLGNEARMNMPGTLDGNWTWRLEEGQLDEAAISLLRDLTRLYGRDPGTRRDPDATRFS
jgi:4-alpha-glucanotransferase